MKEVRRIDFKLQSQIELVTILVEEEEANENQNENLSCVITSLLVTINEALLLDWRVASLVNKSIKLCKY